MILIRISTRHQSRVSIWTVGYADDISCSFFSLSRTQGRAKEVQLGKTGPEGSEWKPGCYSGVGAHGDGVHPTVPGTATFSWAAFRIERTLFDQRFLNTIHSYVGWRGLGCGRRSSSFQGCSANGLTNRAVIKLIWGEKNPSLSDSKETVRLASWRSSNLLPGSTDYSKQ